MNGGARIEVNAPSFVWGMVRKMVAALREVDSGRLSLSRLESAIHGRERLTLPLAEADRLVLWDVDYGLEWSNVWRGPNRQQSRWWASEIAAASARNQVLSAIRPLSDGVVADSR